MIHALALAAATAAPTFSRTKRCDPVKVTFASKWGGLPGTVNSNAGTLERAGYDFVMGDRVFPGSTVTTLAAALESPAVGAPPKLQFGREVLARYAGRALSWSFQDDVRMGEARSTYTAMFEDEGRLTSFLSHLTWAPFVMTDDYPDEDIVMRCADGRTVEGRSTSQAPYGVPWTVTGPAGTMTTNNIEIGRSLSSLLGDADVNRAQLSDDGVMQAYAQAVLVAFTAIAPAPDSFDRFPVLKAYLKTAGFTHPPNVLEPVADRWDYGDVVSAEQPGFGFYGAIGGGDENEEGRVVVDGAHRILGLLRRFPWLQAALSAPNQRGYAITPENHEYQPTGDIEALRKAGRGPSADLLAANAHVAVYISLYRSEPSNMMAGSSEWYLLPDGRLLLVRFEENGLSDLGLPETRFGPLQYGRAIGGQVFSQDGTWELP